MQVLHKFQFSDILLTVSYTAVYGRTSVKSCCFFSADDSVEEILELENYPPVIGE